jgi:hypothetical protein
MSYFKYFRKSDYLLSQNIRKEVVNFSQYSAIIERIADDISYYTYYNMNQKERLDTISYKMYGTSKYYWTFPLINTEMINTWRDLPKDTVQLRSYLLAKYPGMSFTLADSEDISSKFLDTEYLTGGISGRLKILKRYPSLGYFTGVIVDGEFPPNQVMTLTGEESLDTVTINNVIETYNSVAYFTDEEGNRVLWNSPVVKYPTTIETVEIQRNEEISQIRVIQKEFIYEVTNEFSKEMKKISKLEPE